MARRVRTLIRCHLKLIFIENSQDVNENLEMDNEKNVPVKFDLSLVCLKL